MRQFWLVIVLLYFYWVFVQKGQIRFFHLNRLHICPVWIQKDIGTESKTIEMIKNLFYFRYVICFTLSNMGMDQDNNYGWQEPSTSLKNPWFINRFINATLKNHGLYQHWHSFENYSSVCMATAKHNVGNSSKFVLLHQRC